MIPSKAGADLEVGLARQASQKSKKNQSKENYEAPKFTGENRDYVVKNGDTLYSTAHAHDLGWKVLMEANGLTNRSTLRIGQHLKIPVKVGAVTHVKISGGKAQ